MSQLELLYERLQQLSPQTLVSLIDELEIVILDNEYKEMSLDIYNRVKKGYNITHKQKRVLVNIIGIQ